MKIKMFVAGAPLQRLSQNQVSIPETFSLSIKITLVYECGQDCWLEEPMRVHGA
jgi:hypothetical protein